MKPICVNGKKVCLLVTGNEVTVRFYNKDKSFKDYDLRHSDINVIIDDSDAYLYPDTEVIDYSPQTLGKK